MKQWAWFFGVILLADWFMGCSPGSSPPASPTPQATAIKSASAPLTVNSQPASPDDPLVAEWTNGKIYLSQIDRLLESRRQALAKVTNDAALIDKMVIKERRQVLDTLVDNYLLLTEAHNRNLTLTSVEMEQLARSVREQFNSESEYVKYLQQAGRTEEDAVKVLANIRLGQKCMDDQKKQIAEYLTPEKKKRFYDDNISLFTSPQRTQINRVEIWANDKRTSQEAEALARKLYEELKPKVEAEPDLEKKRKFLQDCAYKNSDTAEAKYNYGYLTIIHDATAALKYPQRFLEEAKNLEIGKLSSLLPTKGGYGFFLVVTQSPSVTQPYDSAQNYIPNWYLNMKLQEWHEELKRKYGLKIYSEPLEPKSEPGKLIGNHPPVFPTMRS